MMLRNGNRIRKNGGMQMVRELKYFDSVEPRDSGPSVSEIRRRAYEIYLSRGDTPGSPELDWLQAETELRARNAAARSK